MGLDVSHDAFSGAYSSFNRFRQFVMRSIGGSFPPHEDKSLDGGLWYWGEGYTHEANEGLYEFFMHSDCDGIIEPKMCRKIANELEAILPRIEELAKTEESRGHILRDGGYVEVTKKFIAGCKIAAKRRQKLKFH